MSFDDSNALRKRVHELEARVHEMEAEMASRNREIARLQRGIKASEVTETQVPIAEFEDTLKRLVQRVAMILQAEKCAIMILDKETGELVARAPAFGIAETDLQMMRVKVSQGIAGDVFRSEKPAMFHDAVTDPRTVKDNVALLHIRNGVVVPLIVEKRDEENRVLDRITIGVIGVYNKRYGGSFIDEDVRLLERLARNAASVIANAQMFRELVEEREKLAHTIESLYAGLLLVGTNGKLMQMNARARQIFGITTDPVGKQYAEVVRHDRALEVLGRMLAVPESGANGATDDEDSRAAEEITVPEPETEEERIYQMHAAQVRAEDNRLIGTAIILNDITDIRNLERMKTEFVAIAAHELRTPMTPIKGFISMLNQDDMDSFTFEERKEYYDIVEQNVDRLGRLINDLLNVTRIERGIALTLFWEEVDLCQLAESVFEVQRGMTNTDRHTLVLDTKTSCLFATVGRDQIEQILQNLVSNAIKYSPEGGEVRIIVRDEEETQTVLIGVRDQGTGIPESAKAKLFKPYRRIHNPKTASVKGTGIGLFLVKNLVEAHRGTIWVDSELGKGTTVWFRIPKAPPETADVEA
ncbi:MAG: GAF domain-containing protein [Chthonomonadales bacterium]|nr:GAF domain-containing protein [Chthonomonadales bacterium]